MALNLALSRSIPVAAGFTPAASKTPLSRGVARTGRADGGTSQSAGTLASSFSLSGRDVRCSRRRRGTTRAGMAEGGVRASAAESSSGGATTGSEEASGVAAPPPPPTAVPPAAASFTQRVEAAAAALRSGTAAQQRRKPQTPSTAYANTAATTVPPTVFPEPPSSSSSSSLATSKLSRSRDDGPSSRELLSTPENSDEMAASQNRLFEQMVTLRTRLNERLAASNKFARFLESTLQTRDKDLKSANERLVAAMLEIESLQNIAKDAVEAATDATQPPDVVEKRLSTLTKRLELMHKALSRDVKAIDAACIKSVPIRWVGMASDIRIMGTFDHWTKGVAMSPEFIEGGNNVFVADLKLIAGTYEIKFVVDGIWQTAPEWATSGEGLDANNLLVVE